MMFAVNVVTHTPLWVWGILAFVLYASSRQTKDRTVRPVTLLIFPLVFGALAAIRVATADFSTAFLLGLGAGTFSGVGIFLLLQPAKASRGVDRCRIWVRRDYFAAFLIPFIFIATYVLAVLAAIAPEVASGIAARFTAGATSMLSASYMLLTVAAHFGAARKGRTAGLVRA